MITLASTYTAPRVRKLQDGLTRPPLNMGLVGLREDNPLKVTCSNGDTEEQTHISGCGICPTHPYCKGVIKELPLAFLHGLGLSIKSDTEERVPFPYPHLTHSGAGLSLAQGFSHWWKGGGGWI